jgi:hypothetical protein
LVVAADVDAALTFLGRREDIISAVVVVLAVAERGQTAEEGEAGE